MLVTVDSQEFTALLAKRDPGLLAPGPKGSSDQNKIYTTSHIVNLIPINSRISTATDSDSDQRSNVLVRKPRPGLSVMVTVLPTKSARRFAAGT